MGLDIYHHKATLIKPEGLNPFSENYVVEDDYDGFDEDFSFFENYVQMIEIPKTLRTFIFAKKESELEEIKAFLERDYEFYYESDVQNIAGVVNRFLMQDGLNNYFLHQWEAPKWIGYHVFEWERKLGFYYEEVGYQRKGMNERFGERFYSVSTYCYTQKSDFEYALSCVDYYWPNDTKKEVEQRRQQFEKDFVEKHEYKRSWMHISR